MDWRGDVDATNDVENGRERKRENATHNPRRRQIVDLVNIFLNQLSGRVREREIENQHVVSDSLARARKEANEKRTLL